MNSREDAKARRIEGQKEETPNVEELSAIVVDCAYKLHVEAGPGLLESVYEVVLARMLEERGLKMPLGLLINFGTATFKEGVKRVVNQHRDFAASRLRVNQPRA